MSRLHCFNCNFNVTCSIIVQSDHNRIMQRVITDTLLRKKSFHGLKNDGSSSTFIKTFYFCIRLYTLITVFEGDLKVMLISECIIKTFKKSITFSIFVSYFWRTFIMLIFVIERNVKLCFYFFFFLSWWQ